MKERILKIFKPTSHEEQPAASRSDYLGLLGPSFLLLGTAFFLAQGILSLLFLASIATVGFILSWLYQFKGAFYSAGLFVFCYVFLLFLEAEPEGVFSSIVALFSFTVSFYLTAAASEQEKERQELLKKDHEEKITTLESTYQTNQVFIEKQLEQAQQETKLVEKHLKSQEKEMASYKQLMIASKEESEHYYALADLYKKEADEALKKVGLLETYQVQMDQLKEESASLQKKLNESRVQSYEYEILAHEGLKEKKNTLEKTAFESQQLSEEFSELVNHRKELKKRYEEHLREYKAFSQKIESLFFVNQESKDSYQELVHGFEDLGRDLQEIRLDILKVEEGILHLKKELQISSDEGLSPGSYLAIADQECLRLEEENTLLLKLLSQVISKNEKKEESIESTQELF